MESNVELLNFIIVLISDKFKVNIKDMRISRNASFVSISWYNNSISVMTISHSSYIIIFNMWFFKHTIKKHTMNEVYDTIFNVINALG